MQTVESRTVYEEPTQLKFELRDYQKEVVFQTYKLMRAGIKSILVHAPTGSGKTCIASKIIADATAQKRRVLFLIHRDPLVEQTIEELRVYGIKAGIIKAGYKEDREQLVQVASLQTLQNRPMPDGISFVVVDECHTTAFWDSFKLVKKAYSPAGVPALGNVYYLGLTATPWRTDRKEYNGQHFDAIVSAPTVSKLIDKNHLVRPNSLGWGGVDMSKLELNAKNEYTVKSMAAAVSHPDFNETVVKKFKEFCQGRTAIAFCVNVQHSKALAEHFSASGVRADHLDANTPVSVRQLMYDQLRSGETEVLCSVGTLTEGFNIKSISSVLLARPTNSVSLLLQMCGRGLRLSPETQKKDCLLLDFCENFKRLQDVEGEKKASLCVEKNYLYKPGQSNNPYKECPNCGSIVAKMMLACPECEYQFPFEKREVELAKDTWKSQFGVFLDKTERDKALYYRARLREAFSKYVSPSKVEDEFYERFQHFPLEIWRKGALFGGGKTEEEQFHFLSYLMAIRPKAPDAWYEYQMKVEFGNAYISEEQDEHVVEQFTQFKECHNERSLHSLLGIPEEANPEEHFKEISAKQNLLRKKGLGKEASRLTIIFIEANLLFKKRQGADSGFPSS